MPGEAKIGSFILWCAVYAGTAAYLIKHFSGAAGECPIWIPAGIGLGFLLIYGWRYWPVIFVGAMLGEIGGGHTVFMSAGLASGALLGNAVAYTMLKIARFDRQLLTLRDFILLIAISAIAAIVSASINIEFLKMGVYFLEIHTKYIQNGIPVIFLVWLFSLQFCSYFASDYFQNGQCRKKPVSV